MELLALPHKPAKKIVSRRLSTKAAERNAQTFVITDEDERKAAYGIIDAYFARMKGDESQLTDAEHTHFQTIAKAIQAYEKQHFPLPSRQESLMQGFSIGVWNAATVKDFRTEYQLTQANVAEFLGVSQARVAEMESGKHEFSQTTRIALDRVKIYIHHALYGE
jgi:DNA-binding transcriptional regulator YiaG